MESEAASEFEPTNPPQKIGEGAWRNEIGSFGCYEETQGYAPTGG